MTTPTTTKELLAITPASYPAQAALWAAEARADAARYYRRARKCERDARRWDEAARLSDKNADFYERHTADDDPEFAALCAERAPESRDAAEGWRALAAAERRHAPDWRKLGAAAAKRARGFQAIADGKTE